ncbi:hypothetical protein [Kocuria sp. KH4]
MSATDAAVAPADQTAPRVIRPGDPEPDHASRWRKPQHDTGTFLRWWPEHQGWSWLGRFGVPWDTVMQSNPELIEVTDRG